MESFALSYLCHPCLQAVFMDMVEMNGGSSLTPPPWQVMVASHSTRIRS